MRFLTLKALLLLIASSSLAHAQTTWSSAILPGAPLPSDLWLTSNTAGTNQFDFALGAGGSIARFRASREASKELLPYGSSITASNIHWGLMAGTALDDADPATDDRYYLCQAGTASGRLAPVVQVEKNATTQVVDTYAVAQDQWSTHLQTAVQSKVSHLVRYEPLSDGSVKVRRVIRFGDATVNGTPLDITAPYFENLHSFHVANFNALAEKLKTNGSPETYYYQGTNIPQNPQTDVTLTHGYAVVYNKDDTVNRAALGVVFGKTQMAVPNQMIVNYSDSTTAISVRPGIRLTNATPGSILDVTYYLVPSHGLSSAFTSRLNNLVASVPVPVVYPPGHSFTGELTTIVQRLNDNLALPGLRSDRLGHDVTPAAVTTRPILLNGPEDDADIRDRLAVFPQSPESLLQNYLYGTTSQKQSATNYFFRYPGSGDGNGLRSTYVSEMGRALMWDMYRYDIAVGLGYATTAQKKQALDLAEEYITAKFPYLGIDNGGGGNLYLETYLAMGLAGFNFPEHPDSQLWVSRSVTYVAKFLDTYFPDGAAGESPRYHDWSLELVGKFLRVMQRRVNVDLYDHQSVRSALDWFIRFSSPPLSLTGGKMVTPAWGDSTYSSNGGSHYYYDLSIFAPYYKDRDPDFSARLQDWWVRNGKPRQVLNAGAGSLTNILLLDPRLPTVPQRPNTSTYSARYGMATLRDGSGSNDEFFASFKCGASGGVHSDADMGQIDLFAFGVPLALDSTSGPYVSGTTFNETVQGHNTVRFNGSTGSDTASGSFSAFGTSAIADYSAGGTGYGTSSRRHLVMMKGDYLVVWDETTASSFADWFFHVPGDATLEWQSHKVISKTPRGADLDVHFVLPSAPLVEPTFVGRNISTSTDTTAVRNMLASQATEPTTPGMFTTSGESRFGDGSTSRNPFPFQWLKYFSVRNEPDRFGDFLTVLHPRKTGVTPALTTELLSSSDSGVTLRVTYNGRVDTIAITSSGATVTKGAEPSIQFSLTWPPSGVSGAAAFVKSNFYPTPVTTLTNALTTTGPVEVHTGELALGANHRIPDSAPLMVKPGGTFNTATFSETVGKLIMDGGMLKGSGTLTAASIEWWGGILTAPVSSTGNFVKKGGTDWSRPANLTYTGDTVIESGNLAFQPGGTSLPGTGRVVLANGTGLNLNGASASISQLDVTGNATLTGGTLAVTQSLTGSGTLTNSGNLDLSGVTTISPTVSLSTTGTLTLPAGAWSVKRLIINGVIQRAGIIVNAASHPGLVAGAGTITALEDIPVPTGLSAAVTLGQIALTWDAIPGVTSYVVRRSTTPGGPYSEIGTPTAAAFTDTLVTDGVTYYYVVAARDAYGDSANSTEVSAMAIGPWYFDPNGATAGSVANGGAYTWVTNSWTKTPGGGAVTEASAALRHVQFAATNPGLPLAYSVAVGSTYSGAAHGFRSMRVTQGTVTFTGTPGNFYWTQPPVITADAGTTIRFAQTGSLAFNLNNQNVTFDGAGTTLVSNATVIVNTGSITKSGSGTLVLAASNTYVGTTTINGGTLRLATTDLPTLWLDATKSSSQTLASGAISQWNDANGKPTYVSQTTAANRPVPVTDNTLAGPAKSLVDFGAFSTTTGKWMQMGSAIPDIRALFWVGKTTNENFLLGSTGTDYHFHSAGAGLPIWSTSYASSYIRNGTTWLNGTVVPGTTTNMPAWPALVRIGAFTGGNVNANTLGRDRAIRYGGVQPGEVMIFNTTLTPQLQLDIDAYLAKKWSNTGIGIGNRLPTNTTVSLSNGATLDLTGINFQTLAGLEANDNSGTRVELGAADLSISGTGSSSFDGVITGTGGLRKNGSGTFTLEGSNTYTGPTTVEGGTLVVENSITSGVTVKPGATFVNNGTITGDVIIESGGTYLGSGSITGAITTSPPVVTITSPTADQTVISDLTADLNLTATIVFNSAFGSPAITWSMVSGPGTVTFENPSSATTTARFSTAGTYTLRCAAVATVNGQLLQGSADRIVSPGDLLTSSFTATFREENAYTHACALIRSDWSTGNAGTRDQFIVGTGFRSIFSFPLTGIPVNASVQSVSLDISHYDTVSTSTPIGALDLRRLTATPVEGTGNGSSSTTGVGTGVSWASRTGSINWTTEGGDYETAPDKLLSQVAGFSTWTTGQTRSFASTPALVSAVQSAVTGNTPLDLLLLSPTTTTSNRYVRFASDDYTTNTAQRPQLTLTYSLGNPAVPTVATGIPPVAMRALPANLTGIVSNAENGSQWSLVSGPGDATFGDASLPATTVTLSAAGSYVLRLTASNAQGASSRTLAISVAPNPAAFSDWQTIYWPGISDPAVIGETADPDHDSLGNLLEWALVLEPTLPSSFRPDLVETPLELQYTYTRRKTPPGEAAYQVEWSGTLGNDWSIEGVTEDAPVFITDSEESVTARIPMDTTGRCFLRLKISHP